MVLRCGIVYTSSFVWVGGLLVNPVCKGGFGGDEKKNDGAYSFVACQVGVYG